MDDLVILSYKLFTSVKDYDTDKDKHLNFIYFQFHSIQKHKWQNTKTEPQSNIYIYCASWSDYNILSISNIPPFMIATFTTNPPQTYNGTNNLLIIPYELLTSK